MKLNVPLGRWLCEPHQEWKYYFEYNKKELYSIQDKTIWKHKCLQMFKRMMKRNNLCFNNKGVKINKLPENVTKTMIEHKTDAIINVSANRKVKKRTYMNTIEPTWKGILKNKPKHIQRLL